MNFKVKAIKRLKLDKDELLIIKFPEETSQSTLQAFRTQFRERHPKISENTLMFIGDDISMEKVNVGEAVENYESLISKVQALEAKVAELSAPAESESPAPATTETKGS